MGAFQALAGAVEVIKSGTDCILVETSSITVYDSKIKSSDIIICSVKELIVTANQILAGYTSEGSFTVYVFEPASEPINFNYAVIRT